MPQLKIPAWPSLWDGTSEAIAGAAQTLSECVRSGELYSHFLKHTPAFGSVHHGNYAQVDWASRGSSHVLGWWIALVSFCLDSGQTWTRYFSFTTMDRMAVCWSKASVISFIKGLGRCRCMGGMYWKPCSGLSGIKVGFWAVLLIGLVYVLKYIHTNLEINVFGKHLSVISLKICSGFYLHFIKTEKNESGLSLNACFQFFLTSFVLQQHQFMGGFQ